MKKSLLSTLVLVCILAISCTAFAGPFADVPAKHWSYAAVTKLVNAGIVDGVNGQFQGDRTITRYEMAQIVAKAMEHSDKADAENRAIINKLAVEFAQELNSLGVRVTALEDRVGNVKLTGKVQARYDNYDHAGAKSSSPSRTYVDLWANAKINDSWVANVEYESYDKANGETYTGDQAGATQAYATGPAFGGNLTVGKFDPFTAYGLVIDDYMSGAMFEFGNKIKTRIAAGKLNASNLGSPMSTDTNAAYVDGIAGSKYALAEMDFALSPVTNLKAAYHRIDTTGLSVTNGSTLDDTVTYYEGGFDTKLGSNFGVVATASKSDIDVTGQDNKGYFAQLKYKATDLKKPGSYDIFYNNRKIPTLSEIDATWSYAYGVKGNQVGFEYVPMNNTKFTAFYLDGKLLSDNTDYKVYRAQVEFFF